jgi:hypothetical protein
VSAFQATQPPRRKGKLSWEQIVALYRTKSVTEIATLDGTTYVTIIKGLHRLGVKMRPRGAAGRIGRAWKKHGYYCKNLLPGASPFRQLRWLVLKALGGKCCKCGNDDLRVLQVNHIDGRSKPKGLNGKRPPKEIAKQFQQILDGQLRNDVDIRCANCNIIHEYERGNQKDIYAQC